MIRRFCAALVFLTVAACGRTELRTDRQIAATEELPACATLEIGIFGNPGAYDKTNFEQWLRLGGASVQRIQKTANEPVTAATLQSFDVVVLDWLTRDYTTSEASVFAAWVAAGGGVISMSGYNGVTNDDWHANSLLAPLGVAYSGPLLSGPVKNLAVHPVTNGLSSVVFKGGYAIADLGGESSMRTPIAFLPFAGSDVAVGYAIEMGQGRAFVWGDEWIEFTVKGAEFPPQLWQQGFTWISPENTCPLRPPS